MNSSPIALFVYNRLEHTQKTVSALQQNELAEQSDLYIFSDGPKSPEALPRIQAVRDYLSTITGFKSIRIIERSENWGLARSIIEGVTELVNRFGKVVVLEDDLVTSPYFLRYMNDALMRYEGTNEVMHIAGYMPAIPSAALPETFFLRMTSCWGWATWARAWRQFEKDPEKLLSSFSPRMIRNFNLDDSYDYWIQVLQNRENRINTWAVFWYASVFQHGGLCLHPAVSMVRNIGNDGTGIHCGVNDEYEVGLAENPVKVFSETFVENVDAVKELKAFYKSMRLGVVGRFFRRIKSILSVN